MTIGKNVLHALLLLGFLTLVTACQTLPLNGKLPDNLTAEKVAVVDAQAPFAVAPDGKVVALVNGGLKLFHLPTRDSIPLSDRTPRALAWSPFGYSLAAVYQKDGKSSIAIYDQYGIALGESAVDAQLTDIGWLSENELVAGGITITNYTFGSNYRSLVYRWKPGRDLPALTVLRDTTLRPTVYAQRKELLDRGPMLDVSSQAGQILYLHPLDPPLFTPYYKLIMRDMASGKEMEVASVGLNADGGKFSADGERILFGDGAGETTIYDPWSEEKLQRAASAGKKPAFAPEGLGWFADGALFGSDGSATRLAPEGSGRFTTDGRTIVIANGTDLYLLSGRKPAADSTFVPAVAEKVQKLRSLKIQGLVTPKEYKESLERIVKQ
jgi:hypothetical protein